MIFVCERIKTLTRTFFVLSDVLNLSLEEVKSYIDPTSEIDIFENEMDALHYIENSLKTSDFSRCAEDHVGDLKVLLQNIYRLPVPKQVDYNIRFFEQKAEDED